MTVLLSGHLTVNEKHDSGCSVFIVREGLHSVHPRSYFPRTKKFSGSLPSVKANPVCFLSPVWVLLI